MHSEFQEENENFDPAAEQAFLGCILLENELIHQTKVERKFFYKHHKFEIHGKLFSTMVDLAKSERAIDMVTIGDRLKMSADYLAQIGGFAYLAEIAASVPNTKNFQHYANIIIENYQKRELKKLGEEMFKGLDEHKAEQRMNEIMELGKNEKKKSKRDTLLGIYERVTNPMPEMTGAMSHLRDLDAITNGFHRGELIIVGARPSMGKTAFAVNIGTNAAESPDNPDGAAVALFAAEQTQEQVYQRAIAKEGHIELEKLRLGIESFEENDQEKFDRGLAIVDSMNFEIHDKPGMDMKYIRQEARELRKNNPDRDVVIIIDYLQKIKGDPRHNGNRNAEVGQMSGEMKLLARELDCTVVALAQLSRALEQRQDKHPQMSDLRESGDIEQDGDVIMFLYRDEYYNADTDMPGMLEIMVAKQREGPTGKVVVKFMKEIGKLISLYNG